MAHTVKDIWGTKSSKTWCVGHIICTNIWEQIFILKSNKYFFPKDLLWVLYREPKFVRFAVKAPKKTINFVEKEKETKPNTNIPPRSGDIYIYYLGLLATFTIFLHSVYEHEENYIYMHFSWYFCFSSAFLVSQGNLLSAKNQCNVTHFSSSVLVVWSTERAL